MHAVINRTKSATKMQDFRTRWQNGDTSARRIRANCRQKRLRVGESPRVRSPPHTIQGLPRA